MSGGPFKYRGCKPAPGGWRGFGKSSAQRWEFCSCARWMGPPGEARFVYLFCACCGAEQVVEPAKMWSEGGEELGAAGCLACGCTLRLRIVGRDWEPWLLGTGLIWLIDGPEALGGASD